MPLALLERSSRAALPRLTELRPLPEPGASPPRSWHPRLDPGSAVAPPSSSLHTHTPSPPTPGFRLGPTEGGSGQSSSHLLWSRQSGKEGALIQTSEPGPRFQGVIFLCLSFPTEPGGGRKVSLTRGRQNGELTSLVGQFPGESPQQEHTQGTGSRRREQLPSGWRGFHPPLSFAPAPWEGSALVSEFGPSRGSCSPKDLQPAPCFLNLQASLSPNLLPSPGFQVCAWGGPYSCPRLIDSLPMTRGGPKKPSLSPALGQPGKEPDLGVHNQGKPP